MTILDRLAAWWRSLSPTLAPPPTRAEPAPATPDILAPPPMVGQDTLRDWMIHHHRRTVDVWQAVVAEFYTRAAQDPQIAAYFAGVDMQDLQRHFMRALVVVTHIGLTERSAHSLAVRHAHLHITAEHFDRVVGVLVNVLTDYGTPRVAIPQLVEIADVLRGRIVTA